MKKVISTVLSVIAGGWILMGVTVLMDDYIEYLKEKKERRGGIPAYEEPDYCDGNIRMRKESK